MTVDRRVGSARGGVARGPACGTDSACGSPGVASGPASRPDEESPESGGRREPRESAAASEPVASPGGGSAGVRSPRVGDPGLSPEQLLAVLQSVGDGVTVQAPDGSIVFANDRALSLLGLPDLDTLLATPITRMTERFEVFGEDGEPFPLLALPGHRVVAGGDGGDAVVRIRRVDDGIDRWAVVRSTGIPDGDGSVTLAVSVFTDVTEQRRAGEEIRLQGRLLDQVQASVIATDPEGRVSHWNRYAEALFGWTRDEALGRPIASLTVLPQDAALSDAIMEDVRAGRPWEGEFSVPTRDGRQAPVQILLVPLDDAGSFGGIVGVAMDISERHRAAEDLSLSQARFEALSDAMPQIVWTARPDGFLDHYNQRWYDYTGLPLEDPVGWSWERVVHPDDLGSTLERWTRSVRTGRDFDVEYRFRAADGSYRWHLARGVPIRDEAGGIIAWIGTNTDIDERKRTEEGLRFLAEASPVLTASLDYESTLSAVARLAVPRIADWCTVDLVSDSGKVDQVAVSHSDPGRVRLAVELRARRPVEANERSATATVLRTGRSQIVEEIPDELLAEMVPDPAERTIVRALGLRSYMCVPLIVDERPIGVITLVSAESGRRYGRADLILAEELGRRAATAIEHAQLYRRVSQFKWALDAALDCIFMFDPDSLRFSYVNRGAIDQVGYTSDELLAMTPLDIKPEFDERRYRELIAPLISGELRSRTFVTVHRRKDGVDVPVEVFLQHVALLPDGGRMVAIVRDISERVEAQAKLQALAAAERTRAAEVDAVIRAMGDAVVVCDARGFVTLMNPAAELLLHGSIVTRFDDILALFDDLDEATPRLWATEHQGPLEVRMRRRDGESARWISLDTYPVIVDGTTAIADERAAIVPDVGVTILVMRDITAFREAQEMREAFIGVLSHELRTPVTTIYGSAKVLGRGGGRLPDETRQEVYADIEAESERLYRLVEDLLVLARFGDTPIDVADEPLLLQRIVPAALRAEQARWASTRFVASIPPGLATVEGEPVYVEQVLRNLLSNAAKYTPAGTRVELILEDGDDEVVVRVRDEGPGFPAEEAPRLFDLFYRSPLTAASASGAGIGLFVCRRLIEAMGGRIWARNRPGGGAEFGFALRRFTEDAA